ncbi:MAG: hypothetical protein ACOC11_03610 [Prolixibacteraceae bacterium]
MTGGFINLNIYGLFGLSLSCAPGGVEGLFEFEFEDCAEAFVAIKDTDAAVSAVIPAF